jgi:hypothetical protein
MHFNVFVCTLFCWFQSIFQWFEPEIEWNWIDEKSKTCDSKSMWQKPNRNRIEPNHFETYAHLIYFSHAKHHQLSTKTFDSLLLNDYHYLTRSIKIHLINDESCSLNVSSANETSFFDDAMFTFSFNKSLTFFLRVEDSSFSFKQFSSFD